MTFSASRCKARSKSTHKHCRQPAVEGSDFCRLHGGVKAEGSAKANPVGKPKGKEKRKQESPGAPRQNTNALRHGAYSPRLSPDEEPIYEEKRKAFTEALGTVDVFDEQIIHLLSLISTKVDQAAMKGAEHAAYASMVKQILDLMKELKATRASRDPVYAGVGLTYADLVAALRAHIEGNSSDADNAGADTTSAGHAGKTSMERRCSRCGFTTQHEPTNGDSWACRNCGHVATATEDETPPDGGETGADESTPPTGAR